jgi:hypothetical protein
LNLVHVFLHQDYLLDQAVEIAGHGVQKLVERNVDFFHFLLEARNALLELLAEDLVGLVGLRSFDEDLGGNI